jgi:TolB-like protein/Tfp pilus assembly protein PilF
VVEGAGERSVTAGGAGNGDPPAPAGPRRARLGDLVAELKRRRVFRALAGWGIASFAVLQVIEPVLHAYHLPDWPLTVIVTLLALGFPVTVVLAWVFDLTAGGVVRTPTLPGAPAGPRLSWPSLAVLLVGIGLLAAAPGLVYFFLWPGDARGLAGAVSAGRSAIPSIAVLPFADMSTSKDQEYLSDGIAEEILDGLSRVETLHVVGRTSSFSFKGRSEDVQAIARKLGVATVLEGSVRKEGGRIKVTAQLVNAADGYRLWSQSFDRELTGVFVVEEEIGRAVVEALRVRLVAGRGPSSQPRRTDRPEAHEQVLLGHRFLDRENPASAREAMKAFEAALAIDPGYAPAWAGLAEARYFDADFGAPSVTDHAAALERASDAADRAVTLGPDLADGYEARGLLRCGYRWDWVGCRADFERAMALYPGRSRTHEIYAAHLASFGRLEDAVRVARRGTQLDPLSTRACWTLAYLVIADGRLAEGRSTLERCQELAPHDPFVLSVLGTLDLLEHRPVEALEAARHNGDPMFQRMTLAMAHHDLGDLAASDRALEELVKRSSQVAAIQIAEVHAWRGDRDRAFEWLDRAFAQRDGGMGLVRWAPTLRGLRGDPRYVDLLRRLNLPAD